MADDLRIKFNATTDMAKKPDDADYHMSRGLSGITNIGNTCYMNAALQALSATVPFMAYMIHPTSSLFNDIKGRIVDEIYLSASKDTDTSDEQDEPQELDLSSDEILHNAKTSLAYATRVLMKHLWANNCEVRPQHLRRKIVKYLKYFASYEQYDSQEFLSALLDNIHEATKKVGKIKSYKEMMEELQEYKITRETNDVDSIVTGMFGISYTNLETYCKCENAVIEFEKKLTVALEKKIVNDIKSATVEITALYRLDPLMYYDIKTRNVWRDYLNLSYSTIGDIFSSTIIRCTECDICKNVFHGVERNDLLTLAIPEIADEKVDRCTIYDLFNSYVNCETSYRCKYCETNIVRAKYLIHHQPNILVLLIKKYQKYNNEYFKSHVKIDYPHKLDIAPYTTGINPHRNNYELYSVIRQSGGMNGGHYYAYQKSPINNLWYVHDDSNVYGVDDSEPLEANGYVLFYRLYRG